MKERPQAQRTRLALELDLEDGWARGVSAEAAGELARSSRGHVPSLSFLCDG